MTGTPSEFTVYLCASIEEWLVLDLKKGDVLSVHAKEDEPSFGNVSARLYIINGGETQPDRLATESMSWGAEEPAAFDPVDLDGKYYLELRASETLKMTLRVDVSQS